MGLDHLTNYTSVRAKQWRADEFKRSTKLENIYEIKIKRFKKNVITKNASLERVLKKNEKIKKNVKQAASELTAVNEVLKQEKGVDVPVQLIKEVIIQNKEVEYKVAKAAVDLNKVNAELTQEMAARVVLESELADTKTDLADVRDDLSRSQTKEEETRKSALHDALTGLPNRVLFEQSLDNGLNQAKRHGPPVLGKMSPLLFLICVLIMGARRNIHYGHEIF